MLNGLPSAPRCADDEVEQYVRKRLEVEAAGYVSPTSLAQTLKTRNPESPMMNRMIRLTLRNRQRLAREGHWWHAPSIVNGTQGQKSSDARIILQINF